MHGNILTIHLEIEETVRSYPQQKYKTYKDQMKKDGGMFLSEIEQANNKTLYNLLQDRKITLKPKDINNATAKHSSALELLNQLTSDLVIEYTNIWDEHIAHLSLIFLWQRENGGNHPCLELFDYYLYNGYQYLKQDKLEASLNQWYEAYKLLFYFVHRLKMTNIELIKDQLEGAYELKPWIEDYLTQLQQTSEPIHINQQRTICEQFLELFSQEEAEIISLIKVCYAQSFFLTDNQDKGDSLYEKWLAEKPAWIHGWIAWSDNYWINCDDERRLNKAIQILEKALKRLPNTMIKEIYIRLKDLYERLERIEEALTVAVELKKIHDSEKDEAKEDQLSEKQFLTSILQQTRKNHPEFKNKEIEIFPEYDINPDES